MDLVMATVSPAKIIKGIIKKIKAGDMEYKGGNDNLSKTKQAAIFKNDFDEYGEDFVFNNLEYGYVNIVGDGEVQ